MANVTINKARVMKVVEDAANAGLKDSMMLLAQKQKLGMTRAGRYASSMPGSPPNVRRAGLINSINSSKTGPMRWGAGSTFKGKANYAYYMEKGAVVRPKKGKFLPIPINETAKRLLELVGQKGLRSSTFQFVFLRLRSGTVYMKATTKKRISFNQGTKGEKVTKNDYPTFKLARHVVIKPRPWCVVAFNRNQKEIKAAFDTAFANHVRKHLGGKR